MAGFDRLIPEARAYLSALAAQNTRDWFHDNKPAYEAAIKRPAQVLLGEVDHWLATRLDQPTAPKLYRINRDLRFAKDKTPYNTHMHLEWRQITGAPLGFFFGLSKQYCKLGVGGFAFEKDALLKWRDAVEGRDKIAKILSELEADGWTMDPPELKRVPAPYDKDHPRAALLRRKGCVVWRDFTKAEETAPLETLKTHFEAATDLRAALAKAVS